MLTEREDRPVDAWGLAYETDPRCQWCERSLVTRFGGVGPADCPSCDADFKRELEASGGMIEVAPND